MAATVSRTRTLAVSLLCAGMLFGGGAAAAPRISSEGTLDVVQEDDFVHGQTRVHYQLREAGTDRLFDVQFQGLAKGLARLWSGARVRLHGELDGATLRVGVEASALETLADAPVVSGARRAVVLVVNFADSAVSCSDSQVGGILWTGTQNIDAYYREVSTQLVSFPGDTDGNGSIDLYRVSISNSVASATCDYSTWANNADAAATAAGVNLGLYQHKIYVL